MNLIVIAGIKRSASTAQWNLVRLALQMADYKINIHGQSYKPRSVPEGEVDLVKIHPFRKYLAEQADHIFLTDRDDEEILASLDRMWDSGNPDRLEGMRKDLRAWKQYTDDKHLFQYEDFIEYPNHCAFWICDLLDLDINPKTLLDEFNKIEPPEDKQDPVTLLFPNHIS